MPSYPQSSNSFQEVVTTLRQLAAEGFSGSFRAEHGGIVKVLYLCDGRLACASSTDRADRLGTLLQREGHITAEQLEAAQESALPGEALGSVLMNLGTIGSEDLLHGARLQVESVLGSILLWEDGAFRSRPGPLPERAVNLKLGLGPVLLACLQRLEDDEAVSVLLGPGDQMLCALPDADEEALGEEAERLIDLLDGSRDLDSACAQSGMDAGQAARMALGLKALGILEQGPELAASAFAGMDEPDVAPHPDPEPGADLATELPRRDLPRTLDEETTPDTQPQLSFDEQAPMEDRHLEDEDPDEDDPDALEDQPGPSPPPPPGSTGSRARRGWILGAALPLLALLLVFVFSGEDNPPPLNTTTGDEAGLSEAVPDPPTDPVAQPTPSSSAEASGAGVQVPPLSPTDVAIPQPEVTLKSSSGHQAGFDAFQAGDYGKAAGLWKQDWASRRASGFTLQVMVACKEETLGNLGPRLPTSEHLFLAPVQGKDGSTCYKVLWGTYANRAEAEGAVSTVPALFTSGGNSPWPVPLSSLEP